MSTKTLGSTYSLSGLGIASARNGSYGVFGAYLSDSITNSGSGAVLVFCTTCNGSGGWGVMQTIFGTSSDEQFGRSVAMYGGCFAVGAPQRSTVFSAAGAVSIFCLTSPSNFALIKFVEAFDISVNAQFGIAVAMGEDVLAVGTASTPNVYLYMRDNGGPDNWGVLKTVTGTDTLLSDRFGMTLAASGKCITVGAPEHAGASGAGYVFCEDQGGSSNWGQAAKLTPTSSNAADGFGFAIAMSDGFSALGSPMCNSTAGCVAIFSQSLGWAQSARLSPTDGAIGNKFGSSVSLSASCLLAGAPFSDFVLTNAGAAYYYCLSSNTWELKTRLIPSGAVASGAFGSTVALSDGAIAVGAPAISPGSLYTSECTFSGLQVLRASVIDWFVHVFQIHSCAAALASILHKAFV
jgi:hypothetical protein